MYISTFNFTFKSTIKRVKNVLIVVDALQNE